MTFSAALAEVLKHEGGYVNDKRDPGGETKYGISKRSYPHLDIASLTVDEAGEIYRADYWNKVRGDELPPALALCVFDTAVNMGVHRAILLLQRSLGVSADGRLGPVTMNAAKASGAEVVDDFMARRAKRYSELSSVSVFGRGWYRRCFAVHRAAIALEKSE